jgi:enoyl-CoA hydratase
MTTVAVKATVETVEMHFKFIEVARRGHTTVVTINNPPVNALHPDVSDEIWAVAKEVESDLNVRSLVLTGTGSCFVAGGDIRYFTTLNRETAEAMALRVQGMQQGLQILRVPVIAALNGHALGGGCELMMACDIAIAEEEALIGLTEVRLGLIPGAGGTRMLTRLVPLGTAKRLLFTGERIKAAEAKALGLVDDVVASGRVLDAALTLAERINAAGPLAVTAAKRSVNFGLANSLDEGHRREASIFSMLFDTEDHREGIAAFLERRPARFKGR